MCLCKYYNLMNTLKILYIPNLCVCGQVFIKISWVYLKSSISLTAYVSIWFLKNMNIHKILNILKSLACVFMWVLKSDEYTLYPLYTKSMCMWSGLYKDLMSILKILKILDSLHVILWFVLHEYKHTLDTEYP